ALRSGAPVAVARVNADLAIVPRWSATRWTDEWVLLAKQTLPSPPMGAMATLGSTLPGAKLTFDASGGVSPDEISWPSPGPLASTGVRFTSATSPGLPATSRHSSLPGPTGPPPRRPRVPTLRSGAPVGVASVIAFRDTEPRWSATTWTLLCLLLT